MYYRPTLLYLCILIINYFLSIDMQKPKKIDIPPSYRFFRSTLIDYGGPRQNYTDIKTPTPPPPPPPDMHIREYFRVFLRNYGPRPPFTNVWVSPLKKLLWDPTPEPPNVRLQL